LLDSLLQEISITYPPVIPKTPGSPVLPDQLIVPAGETKTQDQKLQPSSINRFFQF